MDEIENEQAESADRKAKAAQDAQARAEYLAAQQRDAQFRARTGEPPLPVDRRARPVHPLGQTDGGAVSKAETTVPSPSLDPRVVMHGIDPEHESLLGQATRAFEVAHRAIEDIFKARNAVAEDETKTPAAQALAISGFAEKRQLDATRAFDAASANIAKTIKACEDQLSTPLIQEAGRGTVNDAIRAHVQNLKDSERIPFIKGLIDKGDYSSAASVLGAPAFLSNLTDDMQATLTKYYHSRRSPELVSRLDALKKAKDRLDNTGPLILTETVRALGSDWEKIRQVKERKAAADRALYSPS